MFSLRGDYGNKNDFKELSRMRQRNKNLRKQQTALLFKGLFSATWA